VILRNRPASVAFVLGALRADACVVAIDPARGVERVRHDLSSLELPASRASRTISRSWSRRTSTPPRYAPATSAATSTSVSLRERFARHAPGSPCRC
jgi:hypothetical protein